MRVVIIPPRAEYQALIVMLQRGVAAALANPHPFAPAAAHVCPRTTAAPAQQSTRH